MNRKQARASVKMLKRKHKKDLHDRMVFTLNLDSLEDAPDGSIAHYCNGCNSHWIWKSRDTMCFNCITGKVTAFDMEDVTAHAIKQAEEESRTTKPNKEG